MLEKGTIKYLILLILSISIFGIIIYPLFDLILCKIITHNQFAYSVHEHIIEPITYGTLLGIVLWLTEKKNKK